MKSLLTLAIGFASIASNLADAAESTPYEHTIRPLIAKYCVECHGPNVQESDLRLDRIASTMDATSSNLWQQIIDQIQLGQMPPKSLPKPHPKPTEDEVKILAAWFDVESVRAELARRAIQGRVVLRRLNRIEYQNTIRDLMGIEVDLQEQLPHDGAANGFDNASAALHTSSFLMERYLEAADIALNHAITNLPKPPNLIHEKYSLKDARPVKTTTESVYRIEEETVICFCSSLWHNVFLPKFYPPDGGVYRFRIFCSGYQSEGKPVVFRVTVGGTRLTGKAGLIGYFDAPADKPTVIEFDRYMEPKTTISILPYGLPSAQFVKAIGAEEYKGPGLAIHSVEVEGPLNEQWPPESHLRLFGKLQQKPSPILNSKKRVEVVSDQPLIDAERILQEFTRRAFRRQTSQADVLPFLNVFKEKMAAEYSFEQSLRAALKGVLISPAFLFLRESPGKLDDYALACRLSYFLWSSLPDDELLELASRKKLSQADELRWQVERMLNDRKAAAFTENFIGQWLGLREIDFTEPSHLLYPEYDHMLKVSMIREAELFFDELLRHDLSVMNFASSDFSLLNGRLAKHYGIPGVAGWQFRKVSLSEESHRGGILTMASVLKVTANGTTTSPVIRGAWVLDRLLGMPPPPPPNDVPAIDPDIRGATTIREQLEKHRDSSACAGCHAKIDPPGFALENFDCIGGWRKSYRVTGNGESVTIDGQRMSYRNGKEVDASGVTVDGQTFQDIDDFKKLILADPDQLARALTTKLLTYGTGAAPTRADRAEIDAIVARIREKNYGLRSLVNEIVQSHLFQEK